MTVRNILADLVRNPESMARVQAEIRKKRAATPASETKAASYDEVLDHVYFRACVRESLRLNGAPALFPRTVKDGGIYLGGQYVPEGTTVAASPWVTMRDVRLYGVDATEYRPWRWLEASLDQVKEWERYDFQFGYGNRACIGKHYAIVQTYKITYEVGSYP